MKHKVTIRDIRQRACQERAQRSRMYARVLTVVAVLGAGATVWQDPVLRADITQSAEDWRPVAAELLVGTPFENMLGSVIAEETGLPEISAQVPEANAAGLNL